MCTGTLALEAKRREPGEGVLGLDGDPAVLERAQTKAESERLAVGFAEGLADRLPYPDDAFDTVLSSLLFHHLDRPTKDRAVRELVRVLRPGGELPWQTGDRLPACSVRFCSCPFDGLEPTRDNAAGQLPEVLARGRSGRCPLAGPPPDPGGDDDARLGTGRCAPLTRCSASAP